MRARTRQRRRWTRAGGAGSALVVLALAGTSGCASAMPSYAGGSTTPEHRGDLLLGGAARLPLGGSRLPRPDADTVSGAPESVGAGGIAPAAAVRYGVREHWDVGLTVAGTTARVEARHERVLREATARPTVLLGLAAVGGWVPGRSKEMEPDGRNRGNGWRLGLEAPLLYAVELGGIYDLWLGGRFGAEHVAGDFAHLGGAADGSATAGANATVARAGPVLGLGAGFRRLHVLLELTGYYERWFGTHGGDSLDGGGFVLVPAFAVRLRL